MKKDNEEELEEISDGEDYNETKLKAGALFCGVVLFIADNSGVIKEATDLTAIYGILGGVAMGNKELMSVFTFGKKH